MPVCDCIFVLFQFQFRSSLISTELVQSGREALLWMTFYFITSLVWWVYNSFKEKTDRQTEWNRINLTIDPHSKSNIYISPKCWEANLKSNFNFFICICIGFTGWVSELIKMVRTAPVKRNSSDTENVGGSPPKVTKVSSQSISKSKRRLLGEIPNPSSSRSCSKTSSSQSQSKPPSSRNVRNSFDKDELAKSAKVSVLLEKVMLQTQQVQAEPELEAHIDENVRLVDFIFWLRSLIRTISSFRQYKQKKFLG